MKGGRAELDVWIPGKIFGASEGFSVAGNWWDLQSYRISFYGGGH